MASHSAGASREEAGAPQPVNTVQLDRLCEKAITAETNGRHSLASAFFRRAAEEAQRLHGETCVSAYLTLQSSNSLLHQSDFDGLTRDDVAALCAEAWALASTTLPFIKRRMDDNTMLPGRGTAVETAFYKQYVTTKNVVLAVPISARDSQLLGLSLAYVTRLGLHAYS